MKAGVSDAVLSRLSEVIASQMGLNFPKERWRDLERGMGFAAVDFGFKDTESCIRWLISSPLSKSQIEILASHLTIGETYFFRDKRVFEILEEHIFPELICSRKETGKQLRIWSAACSTGEEPYSIAILLSEMIYNLSDWRVTILGTDINPRFLKKASEGVYSEWSFRDIPLWVKEKYFKRSKEGGLEILPHIKNMVRFSYLNLAEDTYPSLLNNTNAMDVIFCRNVLMYFSPEHKEKVVQRLFHSLAAGGWLVVSPGETSQVLSSQFTMVNFAGAILYQKAHSSVDHATCFQPGLYQTLQNDRCKESAAHTLFPDPEKQQLREPRCTLYDEAVVLYEQGRYDEAVEKIGLYLKNSAEESGEPHSEGKAMALLARACANQGKLAEAQKWCEKAIIADKLTPGLHYLLATILQEQDRAGEAVVSLKRALYLDQNYVLAHFALGNLARQQGNLKESAKHFDNALRILRGYDPKDVLPESEGITAGRLSEIIASLIKN